MVADSDNRPSDTATIFIILDGFRHDYLERADYLRSIAHWQGRVRETFGFISTRPAMCAGVYPEQTNLCFEYKFMPEGITFRPPFFRLLSLADRLLPNRYLRLSATAWLRTTSRAVVPRRTVLVGNMPFHHFPLFEYAEHNLQTEPGYLSVPTIYDILREHQQSYAYYGYARPKRGLEVFKRLYSLLFRNDMHEADRTMNDQFKTALSHHRPNFIHLHYSACDWVGHQSGPDSPQMDDAIRLVDSLVKEVHELTLRYYRHVRLLVTGDHGMVDVKSYHDLDNEVLKSIPFSEPDDYVCFRDSTMARFWFFKPGAEEAIRASLSKVPWGQIINEDLVAKHHIRFADNSNGDLIFLLEPGTVLMPNYYQGGGVLPKGMHGYDPDVVDNQGAIAIHDGERSYAKSEGSTLDLVDVFPTLLDLHGLPLRQGLCGRSVLGQ